MRSEDDLPIHGWYSDGEIGDRPNIQARRARRTSITRGDRVAPYDRRLRLSLSSDFIDQSFEWDEVYQRQEERLRSESYRNLVGPLSTPREMDDRDRESPFTGAVAGEHAAQVHRANSTIGPVGDEILPATPDPPRHDPLPDPSRDQIPVLPHDPAPLISMRKMPPPALYLAMLATTRRRQLTTAPHSMRAQLDQ